MASPDKYALIQCHGRLATIRDAACRILVELDKRQLDEPRRLTLARRLRTVEVAMFDIANDVSAQPERSGEPLNI